MSVNNGKRPIILKRMVLKTPILNKNKPSALANLRNVNNKLIKLATIPLYREDVIFDSNNDSFLPGEYRSITITNKLNNLSNNSTTIAKCITHDDEIIEKTSDNLTELIGQEGYNTVFYALCSVINQEYKIKAILSLLTDKKVTTKATSEVSCQVSSKVTSEDYTTSMRVHDKSCQTNETRLEKKRKPRRRVRKVLMPFVMKPEEVSLKKVTVDPFARPPRGYEPKDKSLSFKSESDDQNQVQLPDLGYLQDESNESIKSYSSLHSFNTLPNLLINPISLVDDVVKHTWKVLPKYSIMLSNKKIIQVPYKPEDELHIATRENLLHLNDIDRKNLILHQLTIDRRLCLCPMDEDGNLPIHLAVINDDLELLNRQCAVMKIRHQSVDLPAKNGLTALKLSIFSKCPTSTGMLLQAGADPFLADSDHSACVHLAAELRTDHLQVIIHHCRKNARNIFAYHTDELQTPGWETKTDKELGDIVINHLCSLFDKQGHTPVMLASKLGMYENVRLLIEHAPKCVSITMPTSGNTALFLAVGAACTVATERGNKSKVVDHFRKTIEILLENGADPAIDNHNGVNVNTLLQEFNSSELSMLIASRVTCMKYFNGEEEFKDFNKYLLMKHGDTVSLQDIKCTQKTMNQEEIVKDNSKPDPKARTESIVFDLRSIIKDSKKPVITGNILLKPPNKMKPRVTKSCVDTKIKANSKDFVVNPKINTIPTVKKAIWYPTVKRKIDGDTKDTKKVKKT